MKKESMQKNRYWKMYQEEKENVKEYGKQYTEKIYLKKTNKKERIHERILERTQKNAKLKSVQMDLVTNFIKYEVESSSNYDDSGGR